MQNTSSLSRLNKLNLLDTVVVIVSYDISDNKRRRMVAKILEEFGERVQYSVFECILNKTKLGHLKQALSHVTLEGEESIIIYTIKSSHYLEKWRRRPKTKFKKFDIL